jgi:hypothetical protein
MITCFGLSACSEQKSLCKQAMELRATQLGASEGDRLKFVDNCRTRANAYPAEQWKCIVAKMEQGTAYDDATESCAAR